MRHALKTTPGSIPVRLLDAVRKAGAAGLSRADVGAMEGRETTLRDELSRLFTAGEVFAAGSHIHRRWFWCEADALVWEQQRPRTQRELREARRAESEAIKAERRARRLAKLAEPRGKQPSWTPEQIAILVQLYPEHGPKAVAEKTGHTPRAVARRAHREGVKYRRSGRAKPKAHARQPKQRNVTVAAEKPSTLPPVTLKKARGPADQDGPVTYHPNFKFTRYPSPPDPLRTNTFSTVP